MQLQEKLNLKLEGRLTITLTRDGSVIEVIEKTNAITLNAKEIVARAITGQGYFIDGFQVYNLGGLIATSPPLNYVNAPLYQVTFTATFDEASFNSHIDEMRLRSSIGGDFSIITGLNILKDNTMQMAISWRITVNSL